MRTVLINHLLEPPGRVTGITRFMFALLAALLDATQDSYVLLTCWSEQDLPLDLLHPRLSIITQRFWKSTAFNALLQNFTVRNAMRRTGADIEFNVNPLGAWRRPWPRIITVHDLYLETMPDAYRLRHRLVWNALFPFVTRSADHIVVPSTSTKQDMLRRRPHLDGQIVVVPEAPAFAPGGRIGPAPIDGRYGLMVGNMSPNKNPEATIEALALLAARGLRVPMLHVGRDEANLLSAARRRHPGIAPITSIQGVDDATLKAAYAHAAFFINSSLHEGFCLPVVEAQSFGAPVIASNRSALPEVAGDGAILIDPTSPNDIADAIASLWSNDAIARDLSERGRKNAKRFSWKIAAERMAAIFDQAVASSTPGAVALTASRSATLDRQASVGLQHRREIRRLRRRS